MADPTGNYSAWINGTARNLALKVDASGNLVTSVIGSDPIIGSYDDATGKLIFSELIKQPGGTLLGGPFAPKYIGFEMKQNQILVFAGTVTELVKVAAPGRPGLFFFEYVEHGWYATQILPQ